MSAINTFEKITNYSLLLEHTKCGANNFNHQISTLIQENFTPRDGLPFVQGLVTHRIAELARLDDLRQTAAQAPIKSNRLQKYIFLALEQFQAEFLALQSRIKHSVDIYETGKIVIDFHKQLNSATNSTYPELKKRVLSWLSQAPLASINMQASLIHSIALKDAKSPTTPYSIGNSAICFSNIHRYSLLLERVKFTASLYERAIFTPVVAPGYPRETILNTSGSLTKASAQELAELNAELKKLDSLISKATIDDPFLKQCTSSALRQFQTDVLTLQTRVADALKIAKIDLVAINFEKQLCSVADTDYPALKERVITWLSTTPLLPINGATSLMYRMAYKEDSNPQTLLANHKKPSSSTPSAPERPQASIASSSKSTSSTSVKIPPKAPAADSRRKPSSSIPSTLEPPQTSIVSSSKPAKPAETVDPHVMKSIQKGIDQIKKDKTLNKEERFEALHKLFNAHPRQLKIDLYHTIGVQAKQPADKAEDYGRKNFANIDLMQKALTELLHPSKK